jgi:hypothetical protein
MDDKRKRAKALREGGLSYREIGDRLGVTRQRAAQLVKWTPSNGLHVGAMRKIPYKGLREWMLTNGVSISELGRRCECCVERALKGDGCQKYTIDAILRVTGLTYEACFAEIPAEEEYY